MRCGSKDVAARGTASATTSSHHFIPSCHLPPAAATCVALFFFWLLIFCFLDVLAAFLFFFFFWLHEARDLLGGDYTEKCIYVCGSHACVCPVACDGQRAAERAGARSSGWDGLPDFPISRFPDFIAFFIDSTNQRPAPPEHRLKIDD